MKTKEEINAYQKEWYQKNKERIAKVAKKWRLANPDKVKATKVKARSKRKDKDAEYARKYRLKNKDKIATYDKEYRKNNAARIYARNRIRKNKMHQLQTPPWADKFAIEVIYAQARRISNIEGIQYHVDHIIPLNGEIVSGLHVEYNLQLLSSKDNVAKKNTFTEDLL